MNLLLMLIVSGVVGWLASIVMKTNGDGHDRQHRRGHRGRGEGILKAFGIFK